MGDQPSKETTVDSFEILTKAKDKIANPENWTKKRTARNKNGIGVSVTSSEAVCWCSVGAIEYVWMINGALLDEFRNCIDLLEKVIGGRGVGHFNDSHTHTEVMEAFDKAILLSR